MPPAMPPVASLSLVIPVYNEEANLPVLHAEIVKAVEPLNRPFEVLYVDDGSTDRSLTVIRGLAAADPRVHFLSFERNAGQSAGFGAGFKAATGEVVVTLDADLQNDPADIPGMLSVFEASAADMVIGWRARRQDTLWKRFGSRLGNAVRNSLTRETVHDTGCSLKLMRRDLCVLLPMFTGMHRFLPTLMKLEGAKVVEVQVNHRPRLHGVSKYGNLRRAWVGFQDLLAVAWMQKRHVRPRIRERG